MGFDVSESFYNILKPPRVSEKLTIIPHLRRSRTAVQVIFQSVQEFLKKSYSDNIKKFKDAEMVLKKEEEDLLSKKTVLSKEEYSKKSDTLRKKVIDYRSQRRAAMDKITTQRAESRATLIKSINPILSTYIKENNIAVVINKVNTLGGNPENDITEVIVEKLDKVLPSLDLK